MTLESPYLKTTVDSILSYPQCCSQILLKPRHPLRMERLLIVYTAVILVKHSMQEYTKLAIHEAEIWLLSPSILNPNAKRELDPRDGTNNLLDLSNELFLSSWLIKFCSSLDLRSPSLTQSSEQHPTSTFFLDVIYPLNPPENSTQNWLSYYRVPSHPNSNSGFPIHDCGITFLRDSIYRSRVQWKRRQMFQMLAIIWINPSRLAMARPDCVLQKWGRLFGACCFTRGYTRLVERAGSIIQMNENLDVSFTIFMARRFADHCYV